MVIDPTIIASLFVAVFGVLILLVFFFQSSEKKHKQTQGKQRKKKSYSTDTANTKVRSSGTKTKVKANASTQLKVADIKKATSVPTDPEAMPVTAEPSTINGQVIKGKKAKETPEQRTARLERQKLAKANKSSTTLPQSATQVTPSADTPSAQISKPIASRPVSSDGWAVVESKVKTKKPKEIVKKEAAPTPSDSIKKQMSVDSKKIGVIIGPKGSVMKSIQELTGAELTLPAVATRPTSGPSIITLTGTADSVSRASSIVTDLITKGYSARLAGDDFQESTISIHPMYLPEIIGKSGTCIRAIQDQLGVRLNVPPGVGRDHPGKVKITVAGPKDQIGAAKAVISEIENVYHSEITHPGLVHAEIDVPDRMLNFIIGPKGSEIRHIENNFKVSVFIPNTDSVNKAVVVVGPSVGVESSERYIRKIIAQVGSDENAAADVMQGWSEVTESPPGAETDEAWMGEYMYDRKGRGAGEETARPASGLAATTVANAWGSVSASEGW
eukprot:CAMPEP_0182428070 /NCGR_PEP_ID=MMETSP1167-20130531/20995_1 /TAXON_ID=2988 /ORGANISM="Mallomonas Sp, Strain CCMP3275" /LENGTH=500 /DNA_ID=CAMNT_0024610723 /DNA_START=82 /DNA_END=1584 /DNA_ORIENTATION=-